MSYLWDRPGVPRKEWECVDVYDCNDSGDDGSYETCQMCGNEKIRYVHVMAHNDYHENLNVGCVCAEKMSGDYINPKARETHLRNKAARKSNWLKRNWRVSRSGNPFLNAQGFNMVVYENKKKPGKWCFRISIVNTEQAWFSKDDYDSQRLAKLGLFEAFFELSSPENLQNSN